MPNLTFILPHWMYWSGLLLFPIVAMFIVRRQQMQPARREVSLPVGYFLWLTGGFVGLHRFYTRSYLGVVYIPLFLAILFGNVRGRTARDLVSGARRELLRAEIQIGRLQKSVEQGAEGAAAKLTEMEQTFATAEVNFAAAERAFDNWQLFSGGFAAAIALLLLIDAFLLPRLVRRCREQERAVAEPEREAFADPTAVLAEHAGDPTRGQRTWLTGIIDALNGWVGNFVAFWSVIAVFVYYYEVLARYVFNSPTNWAHESMFLMFGMQYLLAGAFAYREDAHVRVDVLYTRLSTRRKAILDVVTSVFFFIFTGTLLWTGGIFMLRSINLFEVSFTEWAVQYWPVKSTIALGALLLLLQGISRLIKDVRVLAQPQVEA
ncbi:MAG: TRAP transporter small permease subunit [Alphaproteobacteria bacterium]